MKYKVNQEKEAVFQLIQSMTGHEKRFFKLFARYKSRKETNHYTRMFDVINTMKIYDEDAVKSSIGIKGDVRKFRVAKRLFYKSILESLRLFHADTSKYMQLKAMLDEVHILLQKRLYRQALSELKKARGIAEKFAYPLYIVEIIDMEEEILLRLGKETEWEKQLENLAAQKSAYLEQIKQTFRCKALRINVMSMHRKERVIRHPERLNRYAQVIKDPLLTKQVPAGLPVKALWHLYAARAVYYETTGAPRKARRAFQEIVHTMEAQPALMKEYPEKYAGALDNYIITYMYDLPIKNHEQVLKNIKKLEQFAFKSKSGKQSAEVRLRGFRTILFKLDIYLYKGDFEEVVRLIPDLTQGLNTYGDQLQHASRVLVYYLFAMGHFGTGNYDQALHWSNKMLSDKAIPLTPDYYAVGKLFNIVVHYELGNDDLIGYLVRSTYRHLAKQQRLSRMEAALLDFIRKELPKVASRKQLHEAFKRLLAEVQHISRDPMEARFLVYFDLISWLESKITGKDFGEIVRAKAAGAEKG